MAANDNWRLKNGVYYEYGCALDEGTTGSVSTSSFDFILLTLHRNHTISEAVTEVETQRLAEGHHHVLQT